MELLLRPRERQTAGEGVNVVIFKIKPLLLWIQGSKAFMAPEESPHLAAIETCKNGFIYKMTYSWLLCALHKRLNNNSFHAHHTEFPSAISPRNLLICLTEVFCTEMNDKEHHSIVLEQTAASKRSNGDMSEFYLRQLLPITVDEDVQQDNDNKLLLNLEPQTVHKVPPSFH